jgi:hypothetical protein
MWNYQRQYAGTNPSTHGLAIKDYLITNLVIKSARIPISVTQNIDYGYFNFKHDFGGNYKMNKSNMSTGMATTSSMADVLGNHDMG